MSAASREAEMWVVSTVLLGGSEQGVCVCVCMCSFCCVFFSLFLKSRKSVGLVAIRETCRQTSSPLSGAAVAPWAIPCLCGAVSAKGAARGVVVPSLPASGCSSARLQSTGCHGAAFGSTRTPASSRCPAQGRSLCPSQEHSRSVA